MITVDAVMALIAPHTCISCGVEGSVLCKTCLLTAGEPIEPRCAGCHSLSPNYKTCESCIHWLKAYSVFVSTKYEGLYEQLLRSLKFDLMRQAVDPIAQIMTEVIENKNLPVDLLLCPLPTAPSRIRQRGFDHTKLITNQIYKKTGYKSKTLLNRKTNVRQLGSTRAQRIDQMTQEFYISNPENVEGRTILLVDDVMTTGASISSASAVLKKAGAKRVYAVVFAQKV